MQDSKTQGGETPAPETDLLRHELGQEILMKSDCSPSASNHHNICGMIMGREAWTTSPGRRAGFSRAQQTHLMDCFPPSKGGRIVDAAQCRIYTGRHTPDGSRFICGFQDYRVGIYNTEDWSLIKDIHAKNLQWTITDTDLSPDQRWCIYSSITPWVHLVDVSSDTGVKSIANVTDIHETLALSNHRLGIWSVEFSSEGREIVAGANDAAVYIYDLQAGKTVLRLPAHMDDINSVTFADDSPNLILTGSDDHLIKLWDRRCLGTQGAPVGVFPGHTEGLTHVSSKGDGRYCISNSKDQTIKLWDVRKIMANDKFASLPPQKRQFQHWDYRWHKYPGRKLRIEHPHDVSLMTYRGHHVLQTLIRCYFSPAHTTAQRYIYSGSQDGGIYVWDVLTGKLLRRNKAHHGTVRDVSWHPTKASMVSVSWDTTIVEWSGGSNILNDTELYEDHCHCVSPEQSDSDDSDDSDDSGAADDEDDDGDYDEEPLIHSLRQDEEDGMDEDEDEDEEEDTDEEEEEDYEIEGIFAVPLPHSYESD
ncbi:hypothetical protein CYMTET_3488 [Cymbomonas tetramitiformis]|uniref:Uncharacterized protein n=2 Tax=Cymbomonas tetramitiformis TaxID=36881 RepID=A0AAE0H387_9CHLO|nr:hypothetical protein CYMTET_3488 [Cymbomonas tetramitiformis]